MTHTSNVAWYAVQTQPHAEAKAMAHLQRQGFEVYLPRFMKRRRHAGRVETVAQALFPGYLFVAIDVTTQRWRCVNSTIGVRRLVSNGDAPAPIAPRVIETLQRQHDERGYFQMRPAPRFAAGDKVRVVDGVFSSALAIYEGMPDQHRVAVLLELLGRKVRVHIDLDSVAAA
jgi:transcriptional antiterminator RfaH